jgi:hypothetical protein
MKPLIGVVLFLVTAILAPLAVEEIKAWCPVIANRLLKRAVSKLPEPERTRLAEEWAAEVGEIPGPLSKGPFLGQPHKRCSSNQTSTTNSP